MPSRDRSCRGWPAARSPRREHQAHPDAGHDERRDELGIGQISRHRDGDPEQGHRLQPEPGDHEHAGAHAGAMTPASGATNIGARVQGVVCTAASSGVEPCTTCMYWIRMNTAPNVPKLKAKPTMFVTENERSPNRRSGISGAFARTCQSTNTISSATAPTISAHHARRAPAVVVTATMACTRPSTAAPARSAPTTSIRAR